MIVTYSSSSARRCCCGRSAGRSSACAACAAGLTVLTGVIVAVYAGSSLPTTGFGNGFNFAEPAVLTQDWASASVWVATAAALGLLAAWDPAGARRPALA